MTNFPYTMREEPCSTCGQPRQFVDGASLRAAREVKGVALREMARRIHFTAAYLCDIELNRRHATPEIVAAYKRHL